MASGKARQLPQTGKRHKFSSRLWSPIDELCKTSVHEFWTKIFGYLAQFYQ